MNSSFIRYILGTMMKIEAVLLLFPALVGGIYGESQLIAYIMTSALSGALGFIFTYKKVPDHTLYLKDGCVATGACWLVLSSIGALPFVITGEIPNYINALFESVSGFTTTGSTILTDVEAMCHATLFWRSFTHWIGGMGILVFILAIIPLSGGSNMNLMKAESTGASVSKLVPKLRETAKILYLIYFGLTAIECILLIIARMPVFDAINTALATAGTGGYGIKNDSIGGYSLVIQWIVGIFMLAFGVNFYAYYFIVFRKIRKALALEEVKVYFGIVLTAIVIVFIGIVSMYESPFEAFTDSMFQVATVISSTGFATTDFDQWPQFTRLFLMLLTFTGSCAGSTGGGIKVSRMMILFKTYIRELRGYIHPRGVYHVYMDKKVVEDEVRRSVKSYFITFVIIFVASMMLVALDEHDLETTVTAVTACINNTGPGLAKVGPTQNFSFFSYPVKLVLIFDMLAGRLELFPMLLIFHPQLWKDLFTRKVRERRIARR